MKVGNFDTQKKIFIVAEIGNNHEGDSKLAEKMILLAAKSNVDAVKFQTFIPELYVSVNDEARLKRLKQFQLSHDQFRRLSKIAELEGLIFLSTPFDLESAEFLKEIVSAFKISSSDNTFYPLLEKVAACGKPVIMSCGLSDISEIIKAKRTIEAVWEKNKSNLEMAILHCVAAYPVVSEEVNLSAIKYLAKELDCEIGFSDHSLGIDAAVLSVAAGARIIEKHFTLDKSYSDFRDHQLSADPKEMKELVRRVREAEILMGKEEKKIQDSEKANLKALRRSVIAKRDIAPGEVLSMEDITWVRPGGGMPPGDEEKILGKKVVAPIVKGEKVMLESVKVDD